MHINNYDKWKYEVSFSRKTGGTVGGIGWNVLVQEVARRKPSEIREVTFFHPEMPGGTAQIPGSLMLLLWQKSDLAKSLKKPN